MASASQIVNDKPVPADRPEPLDFRRVPAVLLLVVGVAAVGWKVLFRGEVFFFSDIVSFFYPCYRFFAACVRGGEFPLWNPLIACGVPYAADINKGAFYPLNFAYVLAPSLKTLSLVILFHLWLGAFGVYLFARELNVRRVFAGVGALAFMNLMPTDPSMVAAGAWTGFLLLGIHKGSHENVRLGLVIGSLAVGLSLLGGDIHVTFFQVLIAACYVLHLMFAKGARPLRARLLPAWLLAGMLLLGVGIAMIQLLPAFEHSRLSSRPTGSFAYSAQGSVPPSALTGLIVPGLWRGWNWRGRFEPVMPAAALLVILLAFPLCIRRGPARAFLLLALVAVLLMLGEYTPFYYLAWLVVPGFRLFRGANEYVFLLHFAAAMLACLGLEHLVARRFKAKVLIVTVVVFAIAFVVLQQKALYLRLLPSFVRARLGEKHVFAPMHAICSRCFFAALAAGAILLVRARAAWWRTAGAFLLAFAIVVEANTGYSITKPTQRLRTAPARFADPQTSAFAKRLAAENATRIARIDFNLVDLWVDLIDGLAAARADKLLAAKLNCLADNENMKYGLPSADGYNTFHLASFYDFLAENDVVETTESPVRLRFKRIREPAFRFLGISHVICGAPAPKRSGAGGRKLPEGSEVLLRKDDADAILVKLPWEVPDGMVREARFQEGQFGWLCVRYAPRGNPRRPGNLLSGLDRHGKRPPRRCPGLARRFQGRACRSGQKHSRVSLPALKSSLGRGGQPGRVGRPRRGAVHEGTQSAWLKSRSA